MFSKLSLIAASLLVTLAAAAPPPPPLGTQNLCCIVVANKSNPVVQGIAVGASVDLSMIPSDMMLGAECTLLTVLGNTCSNTPVNCDSNQLGAQPAGLINLGCVPITL
ncbi:hypothetical protein GGX14DRAFT_566803 [Mycena pura]|uniref:Hydrophobin n=1 Tax=Mycena pura TaxID=153505 RepID=A0AAD6YAJ7_9AGAR|nr:hypothetical protein GGX14DRAFT_566803 [Mycena pura]